MKTTLKTIAVAFAVSALAVFGVSCQTNDEHYHGDGHDHDHPDHTHLPGE